MIYLIMGSGLSLCTDPRERGRTPFRCHRAVPCPAWLQGWQKSHNLDCFPPGFEPGVSSRREFGPCTESWGNSCNGRGRSWLSFGSTLPPACRTHRSVFRTQMWILEENLGGWSQAKGVRVGDVLLDHPRGVRSPPALCLGCLG